MPVGVVHNNFEVLRPDASRSFSRKHQKDNQMVCYRLKSSVIGVKRLTSGGRNGQGQPMSRDDNSGGHTQAGEPLDLPLLRQWLGTLASASADTAHGGRRRLRRRSARPVRFHENEVRAVGDDVSGWLGQSSAEDVLRRLLALGLVQYVKRIGRVPADARAEEIVLDVTAFALWSVAQVPSLPSDWEDTLALLTSPRMAAIVARAREIGATRSPDNFVVLYRMLASSSVAQGTRNLMEDLSDPRRGGAVLAALALAAGLPEPDPRHRQKAAAVWLFTALATGAVGSEGNRIASAIDRMAEDAWGWLNGDSRSHGSSGAHGGTLAEELTHDFLHHL